MLLAWAQAGSIHQGDKADMREMFSSFAQLAAIVLVLITLALSTAAVAQWAEAGAPAQGGAAATRALQVAAASSP